MKVFFLRLFLLTTIFAVGLYFAKQQGYLKNFESFSFLSLGFLAGLTALLNLLIQSALQVKNNSYFFIIFGISLSVKFISSLLFLCYFIFVEPIQDKNFIIPFFIIYFGFTLLILSELIRRNKQISKK